MMFVAAIATSSVGYASPIYRCELADGSKAMRDQPCPVGSKHVSRYSEPEPASPPVAAVVQAPRDPEVRKARIWLFARANEALRCNALDVERHRIAERARSGYRDAKGPRVRDRLSDIFEEECRLDCRSC